MLIASSLVFLFGFISIVAAATPESPCVQIGAFSNLDSAKRYMVLSSSIDEISRGAIPVYVDYIGGLYKVRAGKAVANPATLEQNFAFSVEGEIQIAAFSTGTAANEYKNLAEQYALGKLHGIDSAIVIKVVEKTDPYRYKVRVGKSAGTLTSAQIANALTQFRFIQSTDCFSNPQSLAVQGQEQPIAPSEGKAAEGSITIEGPPTRRKIVGEETRYTITLSPPKENVVVTMHVITKDKEGNILSDEGIGLFSTDAYGKIVPFVMKYSVPTTEKMKKEASVEIHAIAQGYKEGVFTVQILEAEGEAEGKTCAQAGGIWSLSCSDVNKISGTFTDQADRAAKGITCCKPCTSPAICQAQVTLANPCGEGNEWTKEGCDYTGDKPYCCKAKATPTGTSACSFAITTKDLVVGQPVEFQVTSQSISKISYSSTSEGAAVESAVSGPTTKISFTAPEKAGTYTLKVDGVSSIDSKPVPCGSAKFVVKDMTDTAKPSGMPSWVSAICLQNIIKLPAEVKTPSSTYDIISSMLSLFMASVFTFNLESEFNCIAEVPLDDNKCSDCEKDPYRICTKARCKILGDSCYAIEREDGKGWHCFKEECKDTALAEMNNLEFKWYTRLGEDEAGSASTSGNQLNISEELSWNVTYSILKIEQSKDAKCRYAIDKAEANWSEMSDFENNENYPRSQNITIALTEVKSGDHWIYIKCRNKCGIANPAMDDRNWVRFKIGEVPEALPPIIEYIDPESGFVSSAMSRANITLWLNENGKDGAGDDATCKYSTFANKFTTEWSEMTPFIGPHLSINNSVYAGSCSNDLKCRYINSSICAHCALSLDLANGYESYDPEEMINKFEEANLSIDISAEDLEALIGSKKGKLYPFIFRCQDEQGNKNEAYSYMLIAVDNFNITIIKPPVKDPYERMPEIEMQTTSGNVSRPTYCKYKVFDGRQSAPRGTWDEMAWIDEDLSDVHTGKVNRSLEPGNYTLYTQCRDLARIQATNWKYFNISKDSTSPIAMRIYSDGAYLFTETNEEAECVYGADNKISCAYNFSDGSSMVSLDGFIHTAPWVLGHNYYVKCKDKWDNYPGGRSNSSICTTIISPYELPVIE